MNLFKDPEWLKNVYLDAMRPEDIPESFIMDINRKLDSFSDDSPEVSVIITAYNEETNIIRCIATLSMNVTSIPFEILVVNNNSSDNTQAVLEKLHVRTLFESKQGCGPARQTGQENARGKYVLLADADCFYPKKWIDVMVRELKKEGVVCVYGPFSFMTRTLSMRITMRIYEMLRMIAFRIRAINRPYLNVMGLSMGYVRDLGLKVKFIDKSIRGNDGRLAFDLMKYGTIKRVKTNEARVWTGYRSLLRDGSIFNAFFRRAVFEVTHFFTYMKKKEPHDTKTSLNPENPLDKLKNNFLK